MDFLASLADSIVRAALGLAEGQTLLLAGVFVAVFAVSLAAGGLMRPRKSFADRLVPFRDPTPRGRAQSLRREDADSLLHAAVKKLDRSLVRSSEKERSDMRRRLVQAGYDGETAVRLYYLVRVLLAVLLPVSFLLAAPSLAPQLPMNKLILVALGLCLAGLYMPHRFVDHKGAARRRAMQEGFPDALDMLVVCVEAGLGLDAAFIRVCGQIERAHPVLAEQFGKMAVELRAGTSREEALRNLAERNPVQDVRMFVTLLIQSEALGADVAQTLRVQADEMRAARMIRAEETAQKLPVMLSIPLVACILPAMFAVVLGPAVVDIIRNVLPHLGHR